MKCIGPYLTKTIGNVFIEKDTGKCKYKEVYARPNLECNIQNRFIHSLNELYQYIVLENHINLTY